jgi:hypothetical protein
MKQCWEPTETAQLQPSVRAFLHPITCARPLRLHTCAAAPLNSLPSPLTSSAAWQAQRAPAGSQGEAAAVYQGPSPPSAKRVTLKALRNKYKNGEPITMVTAYDYPSAVHVCGAASHVLPTALGSCGPHEPLAGG